MDPITCCLLGLCCPPMARRAKIAAHFESLGADKAIAHTLADDLVTRFDALVSGPFLQLVIEAAKKHKGDA